jgi:predicted SprT family Zn-dependent metalloprotease
MSSLGRAGTDGMMDISSTFIGTKNFEILDDVIRHEYAHLIAGINNGHNRIWKRVCRYVGANPSATQKGFDAINSETASKVYKYVVKAELINGKIVVVQYLKKMSRKFLETEPSTWSMEGVRVHKFFIENA